MADIRRLINLSDKLDVETSNNTNVELPDPTTVTFKIGDPDEYYNL